MRYFLIAVALLVLVPVHVEASGFGVFTQGASGLGQANAVVAHTTGPSSAYFNPALLTQVTGTQVEIGTTGIYAKHKVKLDSTGRTQEGESRWEFPSTFYLTHQVNDRLTAGLAVYYPFGLTAEWDNQDFEGRYIGTYGEIVTTSINPVVAYKVNDSLSLAVGVSAVYLDAELRNMIYQAPLSNYGLDGSDVEAKFSGDDWGLGWNVGMVASLSDSATLGISYRSEVKLEADGEVEYSRPPVVGFDSGLNPITLNNSAGKADVTLPQQVAAGLAYRFGEKLIAEVGVRWEDWESTDQLRLEFNDGSSNVIPRNWHATWAYNLGGQYRLNESLAINMGYLYGKDAVPDQTFEVMIPDSDAHLFTLGADWRQAQWTLSGAFGYEYHEERTKNNEIGAPVGTANGKYDASVYLVGLSLGYKF